MLFSLSKNLSWTIWALVNHAGLAAFDKCLVWQQMKPNQKSTNVVDSKLFSCNLKILSYTPSLYHSFWHRFEESSIWFPPITGFCLRGWTNLFDGLIFSIFSSMNKKCLNCFWAIHSLTEVLLNLEHILLVIFAALFTN